MDAANASAIPESHYLMLQKKYAPPPDIVDVASAGGGSGDDVDDPVTSTGPAILGMLLMLSRAIKSAAFDSAILSISSSIDTPTTAALPFCLPMPTLRPNSMALWSS